MSVYGLLFVIYYLVTQVSFHFIYVREREREKERERVCEREGGWLHWLCGLLVVCTLFQISG